MNFLHQTHNRSYQADRGRGYRDYDKVKGQTTLRSGRRNMSDERQDAAESIIDRSTTKDEVKEPSKQFLDPDKVNVFMVVVNAPVYPYYCPIQADEVAQVEFQKKYGFVKKPVTPRKISSVSAAVNHTHNSSNVFLLFRGESNTLTLGTTTWRPPRHIARRLQHIPEL